MEQSEMAKNMEIAREIMINLGYDGLNYNTDDYQIDGRLNHYLPDTITMIQEWRERVLAEWPEAVDKNNRRQYAELKSAISAAIMFLWNEQAAPRYTFINGERVRVN